MKTEKKENVMRELNNSTALLITDGPDAKSLMGAFLSTHTDHQMVIAFDVAAYVESAPGAFTPVVDLHKKQFEYELGCVAVQVGYANLSRTCYNVFAYVVSGTGKSGSLQDDEPNEALPAYNGERFTVGTLVMLYYNASAGEGAILQVWGGNQPYQQFCTIPGIVPTDAYDELGLLARPDDADGGGFFVFDWLKRRLDGYQADPGPEDNAMGAEAEAVEAEDEEAEVGDAEDDGADDGAEADGAADSGGVETDTDEGAAGAVGKVEPVKAEKNIGPIIVDGTDTLRSQPHKVPTQPQKAPAQANKSSMQPHAANAASTANATKAANAQSHGALPAKTTESINSQTGRAAKHQNRAGNGVSFQTK